MKKINSMTKKVVINDCHGGFGLSKEAVLLGRKLSNNEKWGGACIKGDIYPNSNESVSMDYGHCNELERDDPILIKVVEKLGKKAHGKLACLKIVEIPDNIEFTIEEWAGIEHIAEKHRIWS